MESNIDGYDTELGQCHDMLQKEKEKNKKLTDYIDIREKKWGKMFDSVAGERASNIRLNADNKKLRINLHAALSLLYGIKSHHEYLVDVEECNELAKILKEA